MMGLPGTTAPMSRLFRLYTTQKPHRKRIIRPLLGKYYRRPFSGRRKSVLIVYLDNAVAVSQIHPLFYYASDFLVRLKIELRALTLAEFVSSEAPRARAAPSGSANSSCGRAFGKSNSRAAPQIRSNAASHAANDERRQLTSINDEAMWHLRRVAIEGFR